MDRSNGNNLARVLVIDSDPGSRRLLRHALVDYRTVDAPVPKEGLLKLGRHGADLILLGLDTEDQMDSIRLARSACTSPLIVLTTARTRSQTAAALEAGADDCVEKPFHVPELLARVKLALRHAAEIAPRRTCVSVGTLNIDLEHRSVTREGVPVSLTRREYEVLSLLARHAGAVVTYRQMLQAIWRTRTPADATVVREYIRLLRVKLEPDPSQPCHILTETNLGYRLSVRS